MCSQADDPSQHVSDDTLRAALERLAADLVQDHRGIPYDVIAEIDRIAALAASATEEGLRGFVQDVIDWADAPEDLRQHARETLAASATGPTYEMGWEGGIPALAASATDDRDGPCPTCGCDGIHDAASATDEPT